MLKVISVLLFANIAFSFMLKKPTLKTTCSQLPSSSGFYSGNQTFDFGGYSSTFSYTVSLDDQKAHVCVKVEGYLAAGPDLCSSTYTWNADTCELTLNEQECLNNEAHQKTDNYIDKVEYDSEKDVVTLTTHSPHTPFMEHGTYNLAKVDADPLGCPAAFF